MICKVCGEHESKYKCPVCMVKYCSLACYRNHQHEKTESLETKKQEWVPAGADDKFALVLNDPTIQSMLKYKSLQVHLLSIIKILKSDDFTNETTTEGKREIANLKLCNLRIGGSEENELVEDFIKVFLNLYS